MRLDLRPAVLAAVMLVAAVVLLAACDKPDPTPTVTATQPPAEAPAAAPAGYGLPFEEGTSVTLGKGLDGKALHAGNMRSVTGATSTILFTGQADVPASVDLLVLAGTRVHPVASGTVVSVFTDCDTVVLAHDSGEWSEYLHVDIDPALSVGELVTPETVIGTILAAADADACDQRSNADHLHFAFARPDNTEGTSATWVDMVGHVFCGQAVDDEGVGDVGWGDVLAVPPGCGPAAAGTPQPTPTPTPTPSPVLTGTWAAPEAGATIGTGTVALSAQPSSTHPGMAVTKVVFMVAWGSHDPVQACTATSPDDAGTWTCKANLWQSGAALGKVTLSFDVSSNTGDVARSPDGTRRVTFAAKPPKPTNIVIREKLGTRHRCRDRSLGDDCQEYVVRWDWSGNDAGVVGLLHWGDQIECHFGCENEPPRTCDTEPHKAKVDIGEGRATVEMSSYYSGWGVWFRASDRYGTSACPIARWGREVDGPPDAPTEVKAVPAGTVALITVLWSTFDEREQGFRVYGKYDPEWWSRNAEDPTPSACRATKLVATAKAGATEATISGDGLRNWFEDDRFLKWCFTVAAYNRHGESRHVTARSFLLGW